MALRYDMIDHFYGQWIQSFDPEIYEVSLQFIFQQIYRLEQAAGGHLDARFWQQWHLYNARNHDVSIFEDILWRLPQLHGLGNTQELQEDLSIALQCVVALYEILRPDRGFGVGAVLYREILVVTAQFAQWVLEYLGSEDLYILVYWIVKVAYNYSVQDGFEAARQMVRQLDRKERDELQNEALRRREMDHIADDLYHIVALGL